MVTSKGVGLAVPDWPTTFGYNMFLFPFSKWVGGIFFEHTHRLIASGVGFLTIILAGWLWRVDSRRWVRNLGLAALGAVILQGVLGGLRVTMLKDQIGIFHACLAQAFLGLLVVIALVTSGRWQTVVPTTANGAVSRIGKIALFTTIAIYLQLALGATMRHQHRDLAILDFPTAYGAWIPDTSTKAITAINAWRDMRALSDVGAFQIWLQMVHRFGAVVVAVGAVAMWSAVKKADVDVPLLRSLSNTLVGLVACQIALGAWTIWSNKAADVATTHVAFGALIFAVAVAICALCYRIAGRASSASSAETAFRVIVTTAQ
jgi:cytochrome c oxidase assembly protein subunit 15